jgi:hypothetical protein
VCSGNTGQLALKFVLSPLTFTNVGAGFSVCFSAFVYKKNKAGQQPRATGYPPYIYAHIGSTLGCEREREREGGGRGGARHMKKKTKSA